MEQSKSIVLNIDIIRAAMEFIDRTSHRTYLNGVAIFARGDDVWVSSTNGHIMWLERVVELDVVPWPHESILIPFEILRVAQLLMDKKDKEIILTHTDGVNFEFGQVKFEATIDLYPDPFRVLPNSISLTPAQYNPELMQKVRKGFLRRMKVTSRTAILNPELLMNGEKPAIMCYERLENCLALIMPIRGEVSTDTAEHIYKNIGLELKPSTPELEAA